MAEPTSPIVYDLTKQPLPAKVDTTQTKDSDGFYYRQGDFVEIAGDETVKVSASGNGIGVLLTSIHENQAPNGLDSRHRVAVLTPFKAVVKATANGAIAAGDAVKVTGNKAVKIDPSSATVADALAKIGVCWKGGADGAEVWILV
ncbi:hypothetical protein DRP05_13695 [Archaeoglobales archaeon]|nr:MAG: hypothetical protein DRP05_13695 [Archaeoglobales archaeon]